MKPHNLIYRFKKERFHTSLQHEIADSYDVRIRQTKSSFPLWEIGGRNIETVKNIFDDMVIFCYKYYFIVECPDNIWDITKKNDWFIQLVNIEPKD